MQRTKITWLGHSTFQVTLAGGEVLLIDPWLEGNPSYPAEHQLERVDLLLITHGHSDHFADAVSIAKRFRPTTVAIYEICHWLGTQGVDKTAPMNKGGTQKVGDVTITMTHAQHSSFIEDEGKIVYAGEPAGFVVGVPGGRRFYHAGDTCVFSDMQLIRELYQPELVMLPMGDHFTMGPREAALACRFLQPAKVIPMHYGTFPLLTGTPLELQKQLQGHADAPELVVLKPGQTYEW